ncbi:RGCVC family protein [Amycolatopsis sp. DSM 110486]|uniref:RGCVC family protein n=1 Tax=Amycolatopsis sp. DSM 110486 TaxID=2865832 RepID=UPI00210238DA|nr:RGCVC family protein [Amycolatopsis sp. DSM 110486]
MITELAPLPPTGVRTDVGGCPVCPHETDSHDTIASRFCAATAAGGLHRGCACPARSPETEEEEEIMTSEVVFVSRYDRRVVLVRDVLKADTDLTEAACQALAVRLLHLIDEAPEKVRR